MSNYTEWDGIPDRRATDKGLGGKVLSIEERLDKGDRRMGTIEKDLAENTAATNEVLEIVRMGKSFFRVLGVVGSFVKWAVAVGAGVVSLWAVWKSR